MGHVLTALSEEYLDSQTSLGCPSDAYANSDPHLYGLKPTDAESGRQAASHTKLHTVVTGHWSVTGHSRSLVTYAPEPTRLLWPWDSPGKNTGVGHQPSSRGSSPSRSHTRSLMPPARADWFFTTNLTR